MSGTDPHVHVERKVVQAGADARNATISLLGLVPGQPSVVTTGCGLQVPYAATSVRPESVTCLPCREYAHQEYRRLAEQIGRMDVLPGLNVTREQLTEAVRRLRDLANRFSG